MVRTPERIVFASRCRSRSGDSESSVVSVRLPMQELRHSRGHQKHAAVGIHREPEVADHLRALERLDDVAPAVHVHGDGGDQVPVCRRGPGSTGRPCGFPEASGGCRVPCDQIPSSSLDGRLAGKRAVWLKRKFSSAPPRLANGVMDVEPRREADDARRRPDAHALDRGPARPQSGEHRSQRPRPNEVLQRFRIVRARGGDVAHGVAVRRGVPDVPVLVSAGFA